jgi:hypothetical protein
VWGAAHLPQNRDVFATHSGDGEVSLLRYRYPDQRKVKVKQRQQARMGGRESERARTPRRR